uniref:Large ribosomal subunit protein bL12c n=1 Tax=Caloglossa intermedia TaxID=100879 RepID=A0A1Z1M6S0_9FLOR|nr:ribosomal protein L12 [Caloglossa intermedia]ARW61541.1 ribosomal protein L12 [Caloglossa intermedia]
MSSKISNIIEELKSLTLLEAAELVKQIEEVFDVDASVTNTGGMAMISSESSESSAATVEEKTQFDIILEEVLASKKIAILKVVRSITSLGLKEAKELVESAPKTVKEGTSKEEANEIKIKLEEAGAKVSIK